MAAGKDVKTLNLVLLGTCFDPDFWSTRNKGPGLIVVLIILGLVTIISFLPAGAVVRYYQKRSKRDETPVA